MALELIFLSIDHYVPVVLKPRTSATLNVEYRFDNASHLKLSLRARVLDHPHRSQSRIQHPAALIIVCIVFLEVLCDLAGSLGAWNIATSRHVINDRSIRLWCLLSERNFVYLSLYFWGTSISTSTSQCQFAFSQSFIPLQTPRSLNL